MRNSRREAEVSVAGAIRDFRSTYQYGPSFRDLAQITGLPLGTCHEVCVSLAEQGRVVYHPRIARSLDVR